MTKFTEGEWVVNTTGGETWVDNETGLTVAKVFDMEGHPANAHLIAVAPDMYEMLSEYHKKIEYRLDNDVLSECDIWDLNDARFKLEELLAKARGEL